MKPSRPAAGFTLIEAIMAIMITGIVGAMVAVFIKNPVDAYTAAARRAALSDAADTALRRMGRDIRLALSNSVRNAADGSDQCLEFIPTKIGARYRAVPTAAGAGDALDFTTIDNAFDMLWPNGNLPAASQIVANDIVVVYNADALDLSSSNAYTGLNAIRVANVAEPGGTANTTAIGFVGTGGAEAPFQRKQLPAESPSFRFQVIPAAEHVAGYACTGAAPNLVLSRFSRTLTAVWNQPGTCAAMANGAVGAILAENLTVCSLRYEPPGAGTGAGRFGIVSMTLEVTREGESVRLYHQVHVDNTP